MKGQIADMMEQGGAKGRKARAGSRFSVEELKELFQLRLDTPSDTRDLLCKGSAASGMCSITTAPYQMLITSVQMLCSCRCVAALLHPTNLLCSGSAASGVCITYYLHS